MLLHVTCGESNVFQHDINVCSSVTGLNLWGVLVVTGAVCIVYCTLVGISYPTSKPVQIYMITSYQSHGVLITRHTNVTQNFILTSKVLHFFEFNMIASSFIMSNVISQIVVQLKQVAGMSLTGGACSLLLLPNP